MEPKPIGEGVIVCRNISSLEQWKSWMLANGHDQALIDFIVATSAPKGHPLYLPVSTAARKFFPRRTKLSVINRAYSILTRNKNYCGFLCDLFFGIESSQLRQEQKNRLALKSKRGSRKRLTKEERLRKTATHDLSMQWRQLSGCTGRVPKRLEASRIKFIEDHIDRMMEELREQPELVEA